MKNTVISLFLIFMFSCSDPFVSKETIEEIEKAKNPDITNVGLIYNNDVYYFSNFKNLPIKITNTPTDIKSQIRVNHSGTKIAYLNSVGNPIVIDINGNVEVTLSQYTGVQKIDWTFDDQTLYILVGNQVYFYGNTPSIPSITYNLIGGNVYNPVLLNFAISPNNDIAYTYRYYSYFNGGYNVNTVYKINGTTQEFELDLQGYSNSYTFKILNYSKSGEIMVGCGSSGGQSEVVTDIYIYNYLSTYLNKSFESSESYITPIYNSSITCMVSAYNLYYFSPEFYLSSSRYGTNRDIAYPTINNKENPIYTDWKQIIQ